MKMGGGGLTKAKNRLCAMPHCADSNLIIECLREYELIFGTALTNESGDPGVLFAEKIRRSKISRGCHFK
jgi:hypothetical protein